MLRRTAKKHEMLKTIERQGLQRQAYRKPHDLCPAAAKQEILPNQRRFANVFGIGSRTTC